MSKKNLKILITGVTGFIGSNCAVQLLQRGYDVIGVDNYDNSYENINDKIISIVANNKSETKPGKYSFFNINLLDQNNVEKVFISHNIDVLIHLAGKKAVSESICNPLVYYYTNILTSCNIFSMALRYNVHKIIFSSSATVYGVPQYIPLNENHETGQNITNPYGKTKYTIEELLRDLVACNESLSVVVLRYFNPCGADKSHTLGENPKGQPNNLFPLIAQNINLSKPVNIFGTDFDTCDGTAVRDYIHIDDLVNGHVKAIDYLYSVDHGFFPFNLGTGNGYSVKQILDAYSKINNINIESKNLSRRVGDVDLLVCDASKARATLDWEPHKNLSDMCFDAWHQSINL